jgi:dynein heavy chain
MRVNESFSPSSIHNTSLSSELLGAGTNPRARIQEFSLLLNDPETLMKTNFKKPPIIKTRFPPVLDVFARTIAAPISSLKTYVPLSAKIASYYSPSARTLIIDTESRQIKFLSDDT